MKETKDPVMEKIEQGEVSMKPRLYFVLRGLLLVLGTVVAFGALLYVTSFIVFVLRANGVLGLPAFGLGGIGILFSSLPWMLIILAIVLFIVVELLGRHYTFVYRQPVIYSLLALVVVISAMSFVIDRVDAHPRVSQFLEERRIPGKELYQTFGAPNLKNSVAGVVSAIVSDGLILQDRRGNEWFVATSSETRFPRDTTFAEGDTVLVLGEKNNQEQTIEAAGMRTIKPQRAQPPRPDHKPKNFNF